MSRTIELTPEQIKTLKLFSYYCISNLAEEVVTNIYLYDCEINGSIGGYSGNHGNFIDGYDKVDNLFIELINEYNLTSEPFEECFQSILTIKVDCKERKFSIDASEVNYGSEGSSIELTTEEIEEDDVLLEYFNKMLSEGHQNGYVEFDGSGDSGYIDETIKIDGNKESISLPAHVSDFLYELLENNYGGWEIDHGSSGSFEFNFSEKTIILHFEMRTEDWDDLGTVLYAEF